jgi:hypothetical protein
MDQMELGPGLKVLDGGKDGYDGEALMNEVFDLIRRRLPKIPADDPMRPRLSSLLPALGMALGRDPLVPVETPQRLPRQA